MDNIVKLSKEKTIKLSKPITFEDKTYEVLQLDLEGLTGGDLVDAEREYVAGGGIMSSVAELTKGYLATVAAKAAGVPVEVIHALPAKDFAAVTLRVQNFLLT